MVAVVLFLQDLAHWMAHFLTAPGTLDGTLCDSA